MFNVGIFARLNVRQGSCFIAFPWLMYAVIIYYFSSCEHEFITTITIHRRTGKQTEKLKKTVHNFRSSRSKPMLKVLFEHDGQTKRLSV